MAYSFGDVTTLWTATSANGPSASLALNSSGLTTVKLGNFMIAMENETGMSFSPSGTALVVRSYSIIEGDYRLISRVLCLAYAADTTCSSIQKVDDTHFLFSYWYGSSFYIRFGTIDSNGNITATTPTTIGSQGGCNAAIVDKTRRVGVATYNSGYQGYATSFTYDANFGITLRNTVSTAYSTWRTCILYSNTDNSFCLLYRDYNTNKGEWRKGSVDSSGNISVGVQSNLFNTSDIANHLRIGAEFPSSVADKAIAIHMDHSANAYCDITIVDTNTKTAGNTVRITSPSGNSCFMRVVPDAYEVGKGMIWDPIYYTDKHGVFIPFTYSGTTLTVNTGAMVACPTPDAWAQADLISIAANKYLFLFAAIDSLTSPAYLSGGYIRTYGEAATLPDKPTGLSVTSTSTSVTLNWTAGARATNYNVKLGSNVPKAAGNVTSYTFNDLNPNTTYSLSVEATNASGSSGYTSSINGLTKPNPPQNIIKSNLKQISFRINWTPPVTLCDTYNVYEDKGEGFNLLVNTPQTYYDLNGRTAATTYRYAIASVNAAGESTQSGIYTVTTPPSVASATNTTITTPTGTAGNSNQNALVTNNLVDPIVYTPVWEDDLIYDYMLNGVPVSSNADNCLEVSNLRDGVPVAIQSTSSSDPTIMQEALLVPPMDMLGIIDTVVDNIISSAAPNLDITWSRFKINPQLIQYIRLYYITPDLASGNIAFQKGYFDVSLTSMIQKSITIENVIETLTSVGQKYAIVLAAKSAYNEGHISNKIFITRN